MKHTLIAWMRDKPGVLNRVAGLLRRRNSQNRVKSIANRINDKPASLPKPARRERISREG